MGDPRQEEDEHAHGGLRPRGEPRGGSHYHTRSVPIAAPRVTFFHAPGCHLCDRAREVITTVRRDWDFELVEVDISGDPGLESTHREWLPVVEIDGERAFVYTVPEDAFRRRIARTK